MTITEINRRKIAFYEQHYQLIVDLPLNAKTRKYICDNTNNIKKCRFCEKIEPEVTFRNKAHAIPEFLGNKSIILKNECDVCNKFFADNCENHFANWFGPMRSLCQMRGKKIPKHNKPDEIIIEKGKRGMEISILTGPSTMNIKEGEAGTFKLPVMKTDKYIPIRAAQALIKSAISILPKEMLPECEYTIQWLFDKTALKLHTFPVIYAFTPGPNPYKNGNVKICKRKDPNGKMPFLWFTIATTNFLFQIMVPFCKSDNWIKNDEVSNFEAVDFPTPFPEEYDKQFGKTTWYYEDWAENCPKVETREASFHFNKIKEITKANETK